MVGDRRKYNMSSTHIGLVVSDMVRGGSFLTTITMYVFALSRELVISFPISNPIIRQILTASYPFELNTAHPIPSPGVIEIITTPRLPKFLFHLRVPWKQKISENSTNQIWLRLKGFALNNYKPVNFYVRNWHRQTRPIRMGRHHKYISCLVS